MNIFSRYFALNIPSWNTILTCSTNSLEVGLLGQSAGSAEHPGWTQWNLEDSWRAELPLNASSEDTFPAGMVISTSSQIPLPWDDNQTLNPMPILFVLSTDGVLCPFHIINLSPSAALLTHNTEELTTVNERRGIIIS